MLECTLNLLLHPLVRSELFPKNILYICCAHVVVPSLSSAVGMHHQQLMPVKPGSVCISVVDKTTTAM